MTDNQFQELLDTLVGIQTAIQSLTEATESVATNIDMIDTTNREISFEFAEQMDRLIKQVNNVACK